MNTTGDNRKPVGSLFGGAATLYHVQLVGGPFDGKPGLCTGDTVMMLSKGGMEKYLRGADDRYYWQDPMAERTTDVNVSCPHCGYRCEHATSLGSRDKPDPGCVNICIDCLELSMFTEDLKLRRMTAQEEMDLMRSDQWPLIARVRNEMPKLRAKYS